MLDFFWIHRYAFAEGVTRSLMLTLLSLLLGMLFAAVSTTLREQRRLHFLNYPFLGLYLFLRSTPLLVQFYLIYYGLGQFEWIRNSHLWPLLQNPSYCAILALGLNSAAYSSVIIQGAIRSTPRGEIEACKALGFTPWQQFCGVLGKRMLLQIWPNYTNEIIMVFKATAIASTITVLELMGITRQLISDTYQTTECLAIAGILYLLITYGFTIALKEIERIWLPKPLVP